MIDKSLRQYYESGQLVKPGPGRPGYFGHHPGTGGDRGEDRGGPEHDAREKAIEIAAKTVSTPKDDAREKAIQVAALTTKTPTRSPHQVTKEQIEEQKQLDIEQDWKFQDLKAKEPTVPPKRYKTVTTRHPEVDDVIETEIRDYYSPTGYEKLSRATPGTGTGRTWGEQAVKDVYGGFFDSGIGKALKWGATLLAPQLLGPKWGTLFSRGLQTKRAYDALSKIAFGRNLGLYGSKFGLDLSKLGFDTTKDKVATTEQATKELVERDPESRVGDIEQAVTEQKDLLTEGAKTLGLTEERREQYSLMQNKMKTALDQGSYTNQQGEVIQLNNQQIDQLQNYVDQLDDILKTTLQSAAYGGRIDRPLPGRSRYL